MSDMRDRRLIDPNADLPFDHEHNGDWVQMTLVSTAELTRDGSKRHVLTYACPKCGYELTESTPERVLTVLTA